MDVRMRIQEERALMYFSEARQDLRGNLFGALSAVVKAGATA